MIDNLSTYDAAAADTVERLDETRRELHYADAIAAARLALPTVNGNVADLVTLALLKAPLHTPEFRTLQDFAADYGHGALLRVVATSLEPSK